MLYSVRFVMPAFRGLAAILLGAALAGCAGAGSSSLPHVDAADTARRSIDGGKGASPSPTPAPTQPPQYLIVTPTQPAFAVAAGTKQTVTCALTAQSNDTIDGAYKVVGWGNLTRPGATGSFPVQNYPIASNLAWQITGGSTFAALANDGAPGQTFYTAIPSAQHTYCIDLQISVPATQPAGTYGASIAFEMFGTASANGTGLSHEVLATTTSFNVVVTP